MKATSTHVVTPTARERASAARPTLLIIAFVILVFFGLAALPDGRMNAVPVGIRNPTGDGARALAQVLKKHGVSVREVTAKQAATVGEDTTLVVVFPSRMSHTIEQDVETRANVVYIGLEEEFGSSPAYLDGLSGDRGPAGSTKVAPACASEIAGQAAEIIPSRYSVSGAGTNWQMCFTADGETYAYAERIQDGRFRAVIPDSVRVRNRGILEAGNAALALNAIGRTPKVAWYIASRTDGMSLAETTPTQSPYLAPAFLTVAGSLALLALAFGRRLGPLTPERLPVEVPAAETLIGKARLLRTQRAYGHAASALRSACASRIASSLGVSTSADRNALTQAFTLRGLPPSRYEALLWGPPPVNEAALVQLANDLDAFEKEIRHD